MVGGDGRQPIGRGAPYDDTLRNGPGQAHIFDASTGNRAHLFDSSTAARLQTFINPTPTVIIWNQHKFTPVPAWCSGDFNADGVVDGRDFAYWNNHQFSVSGDTPAVPEPGVGTFLIAILIGLPTVRPRR